MAWAEKGIGHLQRNVRTVPKFANYRENAAGKVTESGLRDYLVLLSVAQTCRVRGISFLQFLLSGKQNIDDFGGKKSRMQRPFTIEVYPRGFIPPHYARLNQNQNKKEKMGTESQKITNKDAMGSNEPV